MEPIRIGRAEYQDKVLACWLGKNIGGTLGAPHEGKRFALGLEFYEPVPKKAAANDDLDLQLVWLQMLEEHGTDPALPLFAEYWNRYACSYPWNEYGFFMRNYSRGLRPPVAGCFENYFVDEMGSPIRSEIWACLHPADPQAAARLAWKDSALDHAGGEGTCGEMFWAAVESAAFVVQDPLTLIRIGLNMIPLASHISRSIREAVWCWENKLPWGDARERIATRFGHLQACNAIPNHGFTILGWLYGRDYGDRLCKAVNCGFDTDCTGATLGSLLGILGGTAGIPTKWRAPVGEEIVLHPFTRGLNHPPTAQALAARTVALAEKAIAGSAERCFAGTTVLPADLLDRLSRNQLAVAAHRQDNHMGVELLRGREIEFHYGGEPVLRPGIAREVSVAGPACTGAVALSLPPGWRAAALGGNRFRLSSPGPVAPRNEITVHVAGVGSVAFTMLGPDQAKGFAAGANVEKCPRCHARVEACICESKAKSARGEPLRTWRVIGPFPSPTPGSVSLEMETSVEAELTSNGGGRLNLKKVHLAAGRKLSWTEAKAGADGAVSLDETVGPAEWACAYGYAEVRARAARETVLFVGSDDGIRVWVNGREAHRHEVGRGLTPEEDLAPVVLRAGVNRILVKVDNYVKTWGFAVSLLREAQK